MFNLFIIYSSIIILIIRTVNAHYCQVCRVFCYLFVVTFIHFFSQSCAPTLPGVLNVHVVCHTHMDTGWVHTFDQYYHRCKFVIHDDV